MPQLPSLFSAPPGPAAIRRAHPAALRGCLQPSAMPLTGDITGLQADRLLVLVDGGLEALHIEEGVAQRVVHLQVGTGCFNSHTPG